MKYPLDTYVDYGAFCKTVVLEMNVRRQLAAVGAGLGQILMIIAQILGVSVVIYATLSFIAAGGAIVYFGSIGALIAANPVLAGVLLGGAVVGSGAVMVLYRKRHVVTAVKDTVVDRYKLEFSVATQGISADAVASRPDHVEKVDMMVERAVADLLNALVSIGALAEHDIEAIHKALGKLKESPA